MQILDWSNFQDNTQYTSISDAAALPVTTTKVSYSFSADFPNYIIAFFAFLGWWCFIFFAAIGLFAIPMDYIHSYRSRPQKKSPQEIMKKKQDLGEKVSGLIDMGQGLEGN